jgi:nucleotide-binding universal stress UspA family protein
VSIIVAAIDNSAAATPVLKTALALAPVFGARVEALHVADQEGITARACAAGLHVPLRTVPGPPVEAVIRATAADDVVAVVLGTRNRPVATPVAGHTAPSVASATAKPVILVPPSWAVPATLSRVLVGIKGTPRRARALKRTVELAGAAGLELFVVHVDQEDSIPLFSDQVQYETELYVGEFLARYLPGTGDNVRVQLRTGVAADEILAAADEVDAHLIAIGWPHSLDPERGHVAREIAARSRRGVVLVAVEDPP